MQFYEPSTKEAKCSKCGHEFGTSDRINILQAYKLQIGARHRRDLCDQCMIEVIEFIDDNQQVKEEIKPKEVLDSTAS